MENKCASWGLPVRVHFAHCVESGIRGPMIGGTLRPGAIVTDARELRWVKAVPEHKRPPR